VSAVTGVHAAGCGGGPDAADDRQNSKDRDEKQIPFGDDRQKGKDGDEKQIPFGDGRQKSKNRKAETVNQRQKSRGRKAKTEKSFG